jgi:hypothetical protein
MGGFELAGLERLVEHGVRFVIGQAREWRFHRFQLGDIAADHFQVAAMQFQNAHHDVGKERFGELHIAFEIHEGHFRLNHPELGEMAAGLGFLCAKRRPETVDLAQRQRGGFHIKLAGLREERWVAEVVELKQRAGALARRRSQDGRIGADEAFGIEVLLCGPHDGGADAQDGRLARRAEPKMAMLHQEVGAVFLRRDGVGRIGRDEMHNLEVGDVKLET